MPKFLSGDLDYNRLHKGHAFFVLVFCCVVCAAGSDRRGEGLEADRNGHVHLLRSARPGGGEASNLNGRQPIRFSRDCAAV